MRTLTRVAGLATAAAAFLAPVASAQPPERTVASYCSSSGDICFGVFARNHTALLRISSAAHYFSRYTLCVRGPGTGASGGLRCGSFPVFRQGAGTWASTVRHARQYPVFGAGAYRVTWKLNGQRLGPTLRFRLPLS